MSLSIGKRRGLAQCATPRGTFAILALDHRGNLRTALNRADPSSVTYTEMIEFKRQVTAALAPYSSAVLLDPELGAPALAADVLPGGIGLVMSVEASGYTGDPLARRSQVLEGWSVGKALRMGANGVKLLIYYHPDANLAREQEILLEQVAEDCERYDLALFLEPLSYSLDPQRKALPSAERRQVVVETARRLTPLGVDILKAEFPLDVKETPDEGAWAEACAELSAASVTPWTLLSAGVDFETYLRQVIVACQAGASGVLVGRAVWKEATDLTGHARLSFLITTAAERMARMRAVCDALARPWRAAYPPKPAAEGWYAGYGDLKQG